MEGERREERVRGREREREREREKGVHTLVIKILYRKKGHYSILAIRSHPEIVAIFAMSERNKHTASNRGAFLIYSPHYRWLEIDRNIHHVQYMYSTVHVLYM